jgi:response regulator RpfG family c-di-GMP phosphodiesterase
MNPKLPILYVCFWGGHFAASYTIATSGEQAIEALRKNGSQFQMVISDFNMPKGNGKVVLEFVRSQWPEMPFLLLTSDSWSDHPEFQNQARVGYVAKPFADETLVNEVEKLMKVCSLESSREHQYVGVSLQTLSNIRDVTHPLFVKINDDKYVRFLNAGSEMTLGDLQKYRQKGISFLYVEKAHFADFISRFKNKVLNDMIFRGLSGKPQETLELSAALQEIVMGAAKAFGLSEDTQELAKRNLELVKHLSEKLTELDSIFQWASFSEQEYNFLHSILITYLATAVVNGLGFKTPHAGEILAFAACFHDIALENHQIKNEQRFIKALLLNSNMNREDLLAVREHPEVAAQMVKGWAACPSEVATVIREHHEKPDRSGFPSEKSWDQIHELSACFIVCEDLVQSYLDHKDRATVEKYFIEKAPFYSQGIFKQIHEFLLNKLSNGARSINLAS